MDKEYNEIVDEIVMELESCLMAIDKKETKELVSKIIKANNIFLIGKGRSGLVAEAFAMRLMQLGLKSHAVGEPTAPGITKKDILIAISGSGDTESVIEAVKNAKKEKAIVCSLTSDKKSSIARKSGLVVHIKAKTKKQKKGSIEPLGSLFEQTVLLYLDVIVLLLMKKLKKTEKFMKKRHANLE
jgi:6-phospho-3-hexuloisomerase